MKKSTIIFLSIAGAFIILILGYIIALMSQYNTAKNLKLAYETKEKANSAVFDNMFKTIAQTSQIPGEKAKQVKAILGAYVQGRGGNDGGKVVTMVREAVPGVELPEYGELMRIITGTRNTWTANQVEITNVANEYNKYISDIGPVRSVVVMIGGFVKIDPKVITSDRTEEIFSTGRDNDTKLFQ